MTSPGLFDTLKESHPDFRCYYMQGDYRVHCELC